MARTLDLELEPWNRDEFEEEMASIEAEGGGYGNHSIDGALGVLLGDRAKDKGQSDADSDAEMREELDEEMEEQLNEDMGEQLGDEEEQTSLPTIYSENEADDDVLGTLLPVVQRQNNPSGTVPGSTCKTPGCANAAVIGNYGFCLDHRKKQQRKKKKTHIKILGVVQLTEQQTQELLQRAMESCPTDGDETIRDRLDAICIERFAAHIADLLSQVRTRS